MIIGYVWESFKTLRLNQVNIADTPLAWKLLYDGPPAGKRFIVDVVKFLRAQAWGLDRQLWLVDLKQGVAYHLLDRFALCRIPRVQTHLRHPDLWNVVYNLQIWMAWVARVL